MEFKKNGISIFLEREVSEPDKLFLERGWFIVSQPNNLKNFDENVRLSKIWVNYKFKNCKYNNDIISKINSMNDNIISSLD